MNKRQAKKIAYLRACKILWSTLSWDWHPGTEYSESDSNRILKAMNEICIDLYHKSQAYLKYIEQLKKDGLFVEKRRKGGRNE